MWEYKIEHISCSVCHTRNTSPHQQQHQHHHHIYKHQPKKHIQRNPLKIFIIWCNGLLYLGSKFCWCYYVNSHEKNNNTPSYSITNTTTTLFFCPILNFIDYCKVKNYNIDLNPAKTHFFLYLFLATRACFWINTWTEQKNTLELLIIAFFFKSSYTFSAPNYFCTFYFSLFF